MAFMRMYGMAGDPGPRPAPRRKSAAAGPRAKASRKRVVRAQRSMRGKQGAAKGPGKKSRGGGFDFGAIGARLAGGIPVIGGAVEEAVSQATHRRGGKGTGEGKQRRSTNPANVKALRRSLRRVERFGHLVARVNKLLPRAHKYQVHPVLKHKRRKRA
jgi:hypothetical protein